MTYTPKFNFHNRQHLTLRIAAQRVDSYAGDVFPVSDSQRRRIASHFCGVADCRCNSGALIQLDGEGREFGIPADCCK